MKIKERSIITLDDDKKYVIVKKITNKQTDYFFALNINDNTDYKFLYIKDNELIQINDKKNISDLILLFKINISEYIGV